MCEDTRKRSYFYIFEIVLIWARMSLYIFDNIFFSTVYSPIALTDTNTKILQKTMLHSLKNNFIYQI